MVGSFFLPLPGGDFLREFPHPAPLPFMLRGHPAPSRAGGGRFAGVPAPRPLSFTLRGHPTPRRAANAAKIGLTGLPGAVTLRGTPHPPAPRALFFSLLALAGFVL